MGATFGDDRIDQRVHRRNGFCQPRLGLASKALLDWQPRRLVHAFDQRGGERFKEGIKLFLAERIEAIAEPRNRNAVEREPSHIIRHVHIFANPAFPFPDQRIGDFDHHVKIAAHRSLAERGQENAMRLAPVGLLAERREQPVACKAANRTETGTRHLAEPCFVAECSDNVRV